MAHYIPVKRINSEDQQQIDEIIKYRTEDYEQAPIELVKNSKGGAYIFFTVEGEHKDQAALYRCSCCGKINDTVAGDVFEDECRHCCTKIEYHAS
jgi:hypothetical protein